MGNYSVMVSGHVDEHKTKQNIVRKRCLTIYRGFPAAGVFVHE